MNTITPTNRRVFLRSISAGIAAAAGGSVLGAEDLGPGAGEDSGAAALARPLEKQVAWQDCEVGVIYHFDMPLFGADRWNGRAAIHQTWDPALYNPARLDTDQWLAAAKALGARYAIVTATHFNGFLQWQSDLYPYGVKQARWRGGRGDLVREFVDSCRRAGIKPGVYMSCFRNAYWKVDRYRVDYGKGGPRQKEFARTCERMVEELCSRYGELIQIWFDAGLIGPDEGGPDVLPIVDRHQPNMVFYHSPQRREHRWIGNEAGVAGYPCWATQTELKTSEAAHKGRLPGGRNMLAHGDPDGKLWSPAMADTVLRNHHWFWKPDTERTIEPLERLVGMYYNSVGRNSNLMLGLTPDPQGLLPEPDVRRCEELGKEIDRRFGKPVAETSGNRREVILQLPAERRIDHVSIMEDIRHGERVRRYVVEALRPGDQWQQLCEGISIGHKRIQKFDPAETVRVRLRITEAAAPPKFRSLAVYSTDV